MKHLIVIFLATILFFSCTENDQITSPDLTNDSVELGKTIVITDKEDGATADFIVNGSMGGKFKFFYKWKTGENKGKQVIAELLFPKRAFNGTITLIADFNPEDLSITFCDPGVTILKPAELSIKFKGIDGPAWNTQTFSFNYLNDLNHMVQYSRIELDVKGGIVLVEKAQLMIPLGCSSRYGFLR